MERRRGVRILALSDRVDNSVYSTAVVSKFGDVDLVIGCGDLPFPYLEYVLTTLNVPLAYVAGNHDRPTHTSDGRTVRSPEGAVNVDGRVVTLRLAGGRHITVAGLGGSMAYGGRLNQYTESEMRRRAFRLLPQLLWRRWRYGRGADLLITHAPPHGVHEGKDHCHTGFRTFSHLIRWARPLYHLHGHIHPSYGIDIAPRHVHDTEVRNVYETDVIEVER